ncbi:MAG: 3-hydroxybutyryl-CoA dehydrogenase 3-hydroxyacyl-CoA dehydrogenase [Subtercola sp.]|nr:3-hydroxybutyryl-CoA dehydrogenase 3-hydroxyacyl-CoA dehydrogenase [Subtercola sp.]
MRSESTTLSGETFTLGMLRDARHLAGSGFATSRDIDIAMRLGAGYPVGPFGLTDEQLVDEPVPSAGDNPWPGEIGVVGTGHMASGIAEAITRSGQSVVLCGRTAEAVSAAISTLSARLQVAVERGRETEAFAREVLGCIRGVDDLVDLAACPVVIEAVVEDLGVKQKLFAALDRKLPPGVRLASNTSSFRIEEVAERVDPHRPTLALHFFNPAQRMRLVEVVTDVPQLREEASQWVRQLGKRSVVCGDQRGFIVNRLLIPFLNDCVRELEAGATVEQIETVATSELGHPMGPLALVDLIGIDVTVAALRSMAEQDADPRLVPAATLERMLAAGTLGRKSGTGFVVGVHPTGAGS